MSCRKDKVQEPVVEELTKWELIFGDYKVYDTLGEYLYDMEIEHIIGEDENGNRTDSLRFINFDDRFQFTHKQSNANVSNYHKNYFHLGSYDPILDNQGYRWFFSGLTNESYNALINDTIKLRFKKDNIQYYLSDITSYFTCICKQIAVKQH